jgi:hypothetical protein
LKKYYPTGWRFYQKPGGPELYFFGNRNLTLLSFFIFFSRIVLRMVAKVLMKKAINTPKHRKEQEKLRTLNTTF